MRSNKVTFVALSLLVLFAGLLARAGAPNGVAVSGTVVDASGAVVAGATMQVRSADGVLLKTTLSDKDGSFIFSGLSAGNYRLVVSNPGFETKEMPVTTGTNQAPISLRISLSVGASGTTVNVQGCAD